MALLPVLLFARNLDVMPVDVPPSAVLAMGIVWTALLIFFILRIPKLAAQLSKAGSSLLAGFVVFALVMTFQLGRATLWRPGPQSFSSPITAPSPHKPRLVWILYDELAYQPVFEARDPSLELPNLDRLRAESTLYSDVTPIAYRTTRAVPSLLLGRAVTDVTYTAENRYLVQLDGGSDWRPFDAKATLFGDYDAQFTQAVQQKWYDLIDAQNFSGDCVGRVTLHFNLNFDGTITEIKMEDHTVAMMWAYLCQRALTEPAPFAKWPEEMRREIGGNTREMTFTFYYY